MKKSFVELSKRTEFIECSCDTCKKTFNYLVTKICLQCQINELEKTSIIRHSFLQTMKNRKLFIGFLSDIGMGVLISCPLFLYVGLVFGFQMEMLCIAFFIFGTLLNVIVRFTKRLFGWSTYYD